jgi:putative transposase
MWQEAIEVRRDITAAVLRKKARREKDGRVVSRLLGIANILDGMERDPAARAVGMTRQTLCDWVHRYNESGIDGLKNRPKGRPKRALTPEQEQEIETLVTTAPNGTLVRWRCVDIQAEIEKRFKVVVHESTIGKWLRRMDFRRVSVRPLHPEADVEAQEAFKKTSRPKSPKSCPTMPKTSSLSSGSRTKQGSGKKAR